jgi:hypothetical protein
MRRAAARHARTSARRRRRLSVLALSAVSLPFVVSTSAPSAVAADPCLTPEVADVMVSQGLPSYAKLVRGKSAVAKYYLRLPGCLPKGASIQVTGGSLTVGSTGQALPVAAPLPLPPIGPTSTAPVPSAESDPVFAIPPSALQPSGDAATALPLQAVLDFTARLADGRTVSDRLTVTRRPDGRTVEAVVEKASNPLRVLVVPMGDAGDGVVPNSADAEFPSGARTALSAGMSSLARTLPVADGADDLFNGKGGLRWTLSAGLLNLGAHRDPETGATVNWMTSGTYCGQGSHFTYVERELNVARSNYNSLNPLSPADRVYGVVDGANSNGALTGGSATCIEGYAGVGGNAAWGRVIPAVQGARPGITGSLAAMELMHTAGAVDRTDVDRYSGGFHSRTPPPTAPHWTGPGTSRTTSGSATTGR